MGTKKSTKYEESIFFKKIAKDTPFIAALPALKVIAEQNSLRLYVFREFEICEEILNRSVNFN